MLTFLFSFITQSSFRNQMRGKGCSYVTAAGAQFWDSESLIPLPMQSLHAVSVACSGAKAGQLDTGGRWGGLSSCSCTGFRGMLRICPSSCAAVQSPEVPNTSRSLWKLFGCSLVESCVSGQQSEQKGNLCITVTCLSSG